MIDLFVKKMWLRLLDWVLPPSCLLCRCLLDHKDCLCFACWQNLKIITAPFCKGCGWPMPYDDGISLCLKCLQRPWVFDQGRSAFHYEGTARELILRFKHNEAIHMASFFGKQLRYIGRDLLDKADYIIPVPLHRWRLLYRGYNQATLLAKELDNFTTKKCLPNVLARHRQTETQSQKSSAHRQRNVRNAFSVPKAKISLIKGKSVVLIDDVWTTGATLNACAIALKKAGVKEIAVLTVARVIKVE